jgi:hypothetical protein
MSWNSNPKFRIDHDGSFGGECKTLEMLWEDTTNLYNTLQRIASFDLQKQVVVQSSLGLLLFLGCCFQNMHMEAHPYHFFFNI